MNKPEMASNILGGDYNCAQAVARTYADSVGADLEQLSNTAAAFGGGIGRKGHVCGAVTGASMIIGLKMAPLLKNDPLIKDKIYEVTQEFMQRFAAKHDTVLCRELIKYEIDTPQKLEAAKETGVFDTQCKMYVHDAAEILEEMLTNGVPYE